MSATTTNQIESAPEDRTRGFTTELAECWRRLPDKGLFFSLLAGWVVLFQMLGISTFGYTWATSGLQWAGTSAAGFLVNSSLLTWMVNAYTAPLSEDGHGLLIPLVVVVLLYQKRRSLLSIHFQSWWPSLVVLGAGCALHVLGYVLQQPRISIVGFFTGIYGLMGLVWGPEMLVRTFFPFFLFGFCIPLGSLAEPVSFPLRILVTKIVAAMGQMVGIDVIREGTKLVNPEGRFEYEVAAACSGIRSLIATIAIATIYAFTAFQRPWKRLVILASAIPLSVLGNVFRMMIIVLAGDWLGQKAGGYVHESSFWSLLPYLPAIMGLLVLGRWIEEDDLRAEEKKAGSKP